MTDLDAFDWALKKLEKAMDIRDLDYDQPAWHTPRSLEDREHSWDLWQSRVLTFTHADEVAEVLETYHDEPIARLLAHLLCHPHDTRGAAILFAAATPSLEKELEEETMRRRPRS